MVEVIGVDDDARVPSGRVRRVAPLVGLAGRTAGEAVVASLRNRRRDQQQGDQARVEFHTRAATAWAQQLGRSRGVLMKAGQILSFSMIESEIDAPYRGIYQAAFAKLQDDAPPMPAELAIEVLTAELGRPPREVFAQFDPTPLAAASIGQVHAATMHDGRRVAVKVQYPGVEQAMRADLANTELLATFLHLLSSAGPQLTRLDVRGMAREISERIGEEIDYRAEAANQQEFADAYRGHPFIRIPEVLPELSTRRVLTMELVDGLRYSAATRADQELRNLWGEAIFRFGTGSMRELLLFNGDPHPGNYLFHPDGTVTFLDFGCVKHFTQYQIESVFGILQPLVDQDEDQLYRWSVQSGFLDPDYSFRPGDLLAYWSHGFQYLLAEQPFTFTPEYVSSVLHHRMSASSPYSYITRKLSGPPEFTLSMRIDSGMTAVLAGLRATGPWNAIRAEYDLGAPPATDYGRQHAAFRGALR